MEAGKRRLLDAEEAERREAMKNVSFARKLKEIERNETSRIDLESLDQGSEEQQVREDPESLLERQNRSRTGSKQEPSRKAKLARKPLPEPWKLAKR